MELSRMVERVGRHRYLVLAVVFALMAGQEIVEMAVLEQPSMSGSRFPLGPLLHVLQIVAIVSGTYVLIDAFRRTSALAAAERRRAGRDGPRRLAVRRMGLLDRSPPRARSGDLRKAFTTWRITT